MYQDNGSMRLLGRDEADELDKQLLNGATIPDCVFRLGQVLEINGAWFKVKSLNPKGMRLKAIPKPGGNNGG
jgi:hypothetical protein